MTPSQQKAAPPAEGAAELANGEHATTRVRRWQRKSERRFSRPVRIGCVVELIMREFRGMAVRHA